MSEIHVKGLADLQKLLNELPAKIEKNIMRGALRAGVQPIKAAATSGCPTGEPSTEGAKRYGLYNGALRDSIRVTTRSKGGAVKAMVVAGGKNKKTKANVFYAHIVEFTGARAHTITAKNRKGLSFGGMFFQSVSHPGMKAKPFMRPALDSQAQSAVVAAGNYVKTRLETKNGIDTAHITVEGDE